MSVSIIFGPPGTGKTTKLMDLLEEELKTVHPSQIAYVSFTKAGANQGRLRAMERFNYSGDDFKYFRTLHSMAFQALGLKRSGVMAPKHYKLFSKKMGMHFVGYYTEDLTNADDKYLFFDELYRNNPTEAKLYLENMDVETLQFVRNNYRKFKKTFALVDYTDMVHMFNERNESIPVRVAFVDEAQDLTTLQWRMVWTAFKHCERIYIAGDDDQAIYQWSGADVNYFLDVQGDITVLRHSYRLPDDVLNFSKRITKNISRRATKDYEGTGIKGTVTVVNSVAEIPLNDTETFMFLSRNNVFLKTVEEHLMLKKVIFSRKGVSSISEKDVKAIKTYERIRRTHIATNDDQFDLLWCLNKGYSLLDPWYESFNWPVEKINYIRDLIERKVKISEPKISIGTIHSVKGAEADNVVILLDVTKSVHENIQRQPDAEHRVFYVGCTRAKKNLYIVNSNSRYAYPMEVGGKLC